MDFKIFFIVFFNFLFEVFCVFFKELYLNFSKDNHCQSSVELILIIGGIIVIVLLVVALYKSYVIELGDEINSGEVEALNDSFSEISSKFD